MRHGSSGKEPGACGLLSFICQFYLSGQRFRGFLAVAYNDALSVPNNVFLKLSAWAAVLKAMGAWGVFILATVDSALFGLPMDPLVAGYVFSNPPRAWLYCLAGAAGSVLGSLLPY